MRREGYFPMIDVLRGFAALSVVTLHTIHHAEWTSFPQSGLLSWFRHGDLGVDLFFVISGFVIMHSTAALIDKIQRFRWRFMMRRIARIMPLYYLTLLAGLATINIDLLSRPDAPKHILAHVLFFHPFDKDWFSSIDGPNWSVGIEMHFYLLMAAVAPLLLSARWRWPMILAFLIVGFSWRYLAYVSMPESEPYPLFVRSVQLPGRLDEFALGIMLALLVRTAFFKGLREIWAIPLSPPEYWPSSCSFSMSGSRISRL